MKPQIRKKRPPHALENAFYRMERMNALDRQDGKCAYCRSTLNGGTATADHIQPRSKGGQDGNGNIAAACRPCNCAKGSLSKAAFGKLIRRPTPKSSWPIWHAWVRRRLSLATERAERNILRSVGLEPSLERKGRG